MKTVTTLNNKVGHLKWLGSVSLLVMAMACGRLAPDSLSTSPFKATTKAPEAPVAVEPGRSANEVLVGTNIHQQVEGLALGLVSSGFGLFDYNISVTGCSAAHSYYNKEHANIVFGAGASSSEKIALPSDDVGCVLHLTRFRVDGANTTAVSGTDLFVAQVGDEESNTVRDSGGSIIFARSTGASVNVPSRILVDVLATNWTSGASPAAGAQIAYTIRSAVVSDNVRGKVVAAVGYNPPSMPAEIYLAEHDSAGNGKIAGLKLMCTLTGSTTACGDLDNAGTQKFKVCAIKGTITVSDLETSLPTLCNLVSTSTATSALAQGANLPFAVDATIISAAFPSGVPIYSANDIVFGNVGMADHILLTDTPNSYLVLYVENGLKKGWKYWKLDF